MANFIYYSSPSRSPSCWYVAVRWDIFIFLIKVEFTNRPAYQGRGFSVPSPVVPQEWPIMERTGSEQLIQKILQPSVRLAISGRRRVGKSFFVCTVANTRLKPRVPVFYFVAPECNNNNVQQLKVDLIELVWQKMQEFDPSVVLGQTRSVEDVFLLIAWLLRSNVWVIIDEFQRLQPLAYLFQVQHLYCFHFTPPSLPLLTIT